VSLMRTFATIAICGAFIILVDAALDGTWPDHSSGGWLVLVGGFVVIGLGFHAAEALYESWRSR
jgi:hypothetical protein